MIGPFGLELSDSNVYGKLFNKEEKLEYLTSSVCDQQTSDVYLLTTLHISLN